MKRPQEREELISANRGENATLVEDENQELSPIEEQTRRERVLIEGISSITHSITDAIIVKNENVFLIVKPDGNIPLVDNHGFGLYFNDCRYLSGYEFKIAGSDPYVLVSNDVKGFEAVFELTNPELQVGDGQHIPLDEVGVKWTRMIDGDQRTLYDLLTFRNYWHEPVSFQVSLTFEADFKDIFAVRGLLSRQPGSRRSPDWQDGVLSFVYEGADELYRGLNVHFSPQPDQIEGTCATFQLNLPSRATHQLLATLVVSESSQESDVQPTEREEPDLRGIEAYFEREAEAWLADHTEIRGESLLLDKILTHSLNDLRLLRNRINEHAFFTAGVPWYVALFGRDSLIAALQTLALDPSIAAETLRLLAEYQGKEIDEWRAEEPGKILHELRVGELARLGEIPHTPYYGSVDSTPLFLITLAEYVAWSGDLELFKELRSNVDRALAWMDKYGDLDGDGYLEYESKSRLGLINQGWKDSWEAIVNADGSLARHPIALVEAQGYAFHARIALANLFERVGERERAEDLRKTAGRLRERFNQDFWLEDLGFYALALQAEKEPAAVISSNPGHALWSGIVATDKAQTVVERLLEADMFSGWGIRTLSEECRSYNPTGYHLGTVWPHDNSLILAGFRRYGFDEAAKKVFRGMAEAAMNFENYRLPELFAGFPQSGYSVPVRYPVACHPQAWSAGTIPFMIQSLLGLAPEALDGRLRIVRPVLPDFVRQIKVRRLRVGNAFVDLSFERTSDDRCGVNVLKVEGDLDVVVASANEVMG